MRNTGNKGKRTVHIQQIGVWVCMVLFVLIVVSAVGCAKQEDGKIPVTTLYIYEFENFEAYVEEIYPDIDLQCERMPSAKEQDRRLEKGKGSDLVFSAAPTKEQIQEYYMDISDSRASTVYDGTIMKPLRVEGCTYVLPLPGQYTGYVINETFFQEAGLDIPTNNQELIQALTVLKEKQIGCGLDGKNFSILSNYNTEIALFYIGTMVPDFLGTLQGVTWLSEFEDKKARVTGTWEGAFSLSDELVEKGFMDPEILGRQKNSIQCENRLGNGTLSVVFGNSAVYYKSIEENQKQVAAGTAPEYTYRMLPMFSNEDNEPWFLFSPTAYIGINKKVDETKKEACYRVLELLSTPEGQDAMKKDLRTGVSSLLHYETDVNYVPNGVQEYLDSGYIYNIKLPGRTAEHLGSTIRKMMAGIITKEDVLTAVDNYYYEGSEEAEYDLSVVGMMNKDLLMQNFNVRVEETKLGNFIADCVAYASDAPIAVVNSGGIRGSFYKGEVYGGDLDVVCPFTNEIVVLDMSGETLWEMLENSVSVCTDEFPGGRFLQISGFSYTFDSTKAVGERVQRVTLPDGKELDRSQRYQVAVNNYMAGVQGYAEGNGDGYRMLNVYDDIVPKADVSVVKETGMTYEKAMQVYLESNQEPITGKLEGRIRNEGEAAK